MKTTLIIVILTVILKHTNALYSGNSAVIPLTTSNFKQKVLDSDDLWLVEFFAPWCGHCKSLAPEYEKASQAVRGFVKLGAVDCDSPEGKSLAQEFKIQGFPTLKFFGTGSNEGEDYNGARTAAGIVQEVMDKAKRFALDRLNKKAPKAVVKPVKLEEIVSESVFTDNCKDSLCIVSFLPQLLDCQSKCRNDFLKLLAEIGNDNKEKGWGWLWLEAGSQSKLEDVLNVGGFGYPAMVVVNLKKNKFSILRGSFSSQGIKEFIRDLSYGRSGGHTGNLPNDGIVGVIKETKAWDGKDAEMYEEEEIDLSDVDLDKDEL